MSLLRLGDKHLRQLYSTIYGSVAGVDRCVYVIPRLFHICQSVMNCLAVTPMTYLVNARITVQGVGILMTFHAGMWASVTA